MICDVLIPCFVQNIVSRGNNIVRGQRRSVRKPHIAAQMEGPHLAAGVFFPAFGDASLREIIVVNGDQTFVDYIINRQYIPFQRLKGPDRQRFCALDADRDTGADVFRNACLKRQDQQDQQDQAAPA